MITPLVATAVKEYISPAGSPAFAINAAMSAAGSATLATSTGAVWNDVIALINSIGSTSLKTTTKNFQKNSAWSTLVNGFSSATVSSLPSTYSGTLQTSTAYVLARARDALGGSPVNIAKFVTILNLVEAYTSQVNEYINAANNSSQPLSSNHWSMDLQTTNGLSGVNIDFINFGNDLVNSGHLLDFTDLSNLGNPALLLSTIKQHGGWYIVSKVLGQYGLTLNLLLDPDKVSQIVAILNEPPGTYISASGRGYSYADLQEEPTVVNKVQQPTVLELDIVKSKYGLTPAQQKLIYRILTLITGDDLVLLKGLLEVNTVGINTAADLLDPKKVFPNSFRTLTVPIAAGYKTIYVDHTGTVNPLLSNFGNKLDQILPTDISIANDALSRSLMQVKNIFDTTPVELGTVTSQIETNKGLSSIVSLTSPVPTDVITFFQSGVDNGSGNNGQILVVDVIGSAAGYNITDAWTSANAIMLALESAGSLNTIYYDAGPGSASTGIFRVMKYVLSGTYTTIAGTYSAIIPAGVYGAGTYDNSGAGYTTNADLMDAIIPGLITTATSMITSLSSTYSSQSSQCNTLMLQVGNQMVSEYTHQTNSDIVFADIAGSRSTLLSFGQSLYNYAQDIKAGGLAYYLENIADTSTIGGQATIAAMRESRNYAKLQTLGFEPDTTLDTTAEVIPAVLSSSQYTLAEASGLVKTK